MKSKPQRLVEMALNLPPDVPDYMDDERKRDLAADTHPYGNNPAYPKGPSGTGGTFAEKFGAGGYSKIIKTIERALRAKGKQLPANKQQLMQLIAGEMRSTLYSTMQYEQGHEQELEQLAIETALDFPEFGLAKQAYADGDLKIIAKLGPGVTTQGAKLDNSEDEEPPEELNLHIPEIAKEVSLEVEKRRMINLMVQGASVGKDHAYHLAAEKLREINPAIVNNYALLMSGGELCYWVLPKQMQMQMAGNGGAMGGREEVEFGEDNVPTIKVHAILFPILVQEIVKGLMSYLAMDLENGDPTTKKYVQGKTDTLENELEDINHGPEIWRQLVSQVDEPKYVPYIFKHLTALSPESFSEVVHHILSGDARGKAYIQKIVAEVKEDEEAGDEPYMDGNAGGPNDGGGEPGEPGGPNDGADPDDWWKKNESAPAKFVKKLLS